MRTGSWTLTRLGAFLALSLLSAQPAGRCAELDIELSSEMTYGDYVQLRVVLTDPDNGTGAPVLAPIAGLRVAGPRGPSSSVSIRDDGRTRTRVRTLEYAFFLQPEPGQTGKFEIGPVRVAQQGGRELRSEKLTLSVYKKPPLGVRITSEVSPPSAPVGAPCRVVYKVHYPNVTGRRSRSASPRLRALHIPILEDDRLKVEPVAAFADREESTVTLGDQNVILQSDFTVFENDLAYATHVFAFDVVPRKAASYEFGRARATMDLPTGKTVRERALLGYVDRPEMKPFSAESQSLRYQAYKLPVEGQPAGFTGAVGRFTIRVKASETQVRAFDPIELEITVQGDGLLEDLVAPDWTAVATLTRNFRVSRDVSIGNTDLESSTKVFRQIIRALNDEVTEIPALPFPHFDPWKREYVSAMSKPIPISVSAARTVDADASIGPVRSANVDDSSLESESELIVQERGIPSNFDEMGRTDLPAVSHRVLLRPTFLLCAILPPALFLVVFLIKKFGGKDPAKRARSRALANARTKLSDAGEDHEQIAQGYQGYFRDRLALPTGELTPGQLRRALLESAVPPDLVERAIACYEDVLAGRFGGTGQTPAELSASASSILGEIDRC